MDNSIAMASWRGRAFSWLCPHGDIALAYALWRRGAYRKWLNYLLVEFQLARGHAISLGKPYWLTIDPTNFCQLQCPFCPTGAGRGVRTKASMSLDHFRRFLGLAGPCAIHMDLMNWGEPLLNKDVPEMIACAKSHGIEVKLDCNLNDVTEDVARRLIASGLDILSVSIDGASQETYEQYRIGGKLEKVLENLRLLVRLRKERGSGPKLIWQFLVFKHNEHEVERARELAREIGVDDVSFVAPFMPNEPAVLGAWLSDRGDYQLYPAPSERSGASPRSVVKIEEIPSLVSFRARRFQPSDMRAVSYLARNAEPALWRRAWESRGSAAPQAPATPYAAPAQPLCKWPWAGMTVNPNGSVSPCCSVEDESDDFGNLWSGGLSGLWNGGRYRRARRHVRRYSQGRAAVQPLSDHVCERCTAIGYANFKFPPRAPTEAPLA